MNMNKEYIQTILQAEQGRQKKVQNQKAQMMWHIYTFIYLYIEYTHTEHKDWDPHRQRETALTLDQRRCTIQIPLPCI